MKNIILFTAFILMHSLLYAQKNMHQEVNRILKEERNLDQLFTEYPQALDMLRQSKKDKKVGIATEIGGIASVAVGGGLAFCNLVIPVFGNYLSSGTGSGKQLAYGLGGIALFAGGFALISHGGKLQDFSSRKKRKAVQIYIENRVNDVQIKPDYGLSIHTSPHGIGLVMQF